MRPTLYTIDLPGPGRLSTMAKPRGHDWLPDEMNALGDLGVKVLVSALTEEETRELGLDTERHEARAAGLEWVSLPIQDRGIPDLTAATPDLRHLIDRFNDGDHIAVHCRFGIGRSSLIVAAILVANGTLPDDAWRAIAVARGLPVPDTDTQRKWVNQLVAWSRSS